MKTNQYIWNNGNWNFNKDDNPQLVLCFGEKNNLKNGYQDLVNQFKGATIVGCSTAGEISNTSITNNSLIATSITFEKSRIAAALVNIADFESSFEAGEQLVEQLSTDGLKFVFLLSDGQLVNGSDLVQGINNVFDNKIPVSGGLAGDGTNFKETFVGLNQNLGSGNIVAIGFYGNNLSVNFGSKGGWDEFGLTRIVTKSNKNVLYEIDGENALSLYKKYLGPYADELPGSALLFPIALVEENGSSQQVRTILSINTEEQSMTFAGNIPMGAKVRLMKANLDNLIDAAEEAVELSNQNQNEDKLAILVSCVGRKIILSDRIEEEHDAARDVLGKNTTITGFYSYGEITPFEDFSKCELHNQTMTVTTFTEN